MSDLDWDSFTSILTGVATGEPGRVRRDSRLAEDLELDSLGRLELLTTLAEAGLATAGPRVEGASTAGALFDALTPAPNGGAPRRTSGPSGRLEAAAPVVPPPAVPAAFRATNLTFHVPVADDIPFLYWLATAEDSGWRWRYRGRVPTPEAFAESLWTGVVTQFVVRRTRTHERIGQVALYDADHENGFAFLAAVFLPGLVGTGTPAGAAAAFVEHVFRQWAFRKLYLEVPEFNMPLIASGVGRRLHEEGRLRRHDFSGGRYWDRHILALYREDVAD